MEDSNLQNDTDFLLYNDTIDDLNFNVS